MFKIVLVQFLNQERAFCCFKWDCFKTTCFLGWILLRKLRNAFEIKPLLPLELSLRKSLTEIFNEKIFKGVSWRFLRYFCVD